MLASKSTKSFLHRLTCRQTSHCTGPELLINSQKLCLSDIPQTNFIVTARSALRISGAGRLEVVERVGRADGFCLNLTELERLM